MSSVSPDHSKGIPSLSQIHSGVPERLANEAIAAKSRLLSQKTVPDSVPRRKPHSLPPDVDQATFDSAIEQLKVSLGNDNVQVNNKPLEDGWYMQHP